MKTAVILGVGPKRGLGAALCRHFAKRGLHVFLGGRSHDKIEAVAEEIIEDGGVATAFRTDVTVPDQVEAIFYQASLSGSVDTAIFNAGNNAPGSVFDIDAEFFEATWRVACFGGFLFLKNAAQHMVPKGKGTIIATGASASMRGNAGFGAFASAKSGLRALFQSAAKELGPKGLHIAHVIVDGPLDGERIRLLHPDKAEARGPDLLIDLEGLTEAYSFLCDQERRSWTFELDVRTYKEQF